MPSQTIRFVQDVKAKPSLVYTAFTNATALKEWLCDVATTLPRTGGRIFMAWNSGYYTCGEFTELEADRKAAFTWRGRNDPDSSLVLVQCEPTSQGTRVRLEHTVPETGKDWEEAIREIEDGWKGSLENLTSVLETGEDLRLTLRPMLGITITDFNAEIAEKAGIPVSTGIRLDSVIEGMGAEAAGLRPNDVIVGMAGHKVEDFANLATALQRKRAGDIVDVEIYRGKDKMTLSMKLSRRPIPAIPMNLDDLSKALRDHWYKLEAEVDEFFKNVTEEPASFKPNPDEWSVKENLAHLIHGERGFQSYVSGVISGQEQWSDDFGGNPDAQIRATVTIYPTLRDLIAEYKRSNLETVALFENLPPTFLEKKGSYWRLVYNALDEPYHFHTHVDQMKAALQAAPQPA